MQGAHQLSVAGDACFCGSLQQLQRSEQRLPCQSLSITICLHGVSWYNASGSRQSAMQSLFQCADNFLCLSFWPCHAPLQAADIMADFFERCSREPGYWDKISKAGLERIYSR